MKNNVILITKDALDCGSLPTYGNTYWKTPNIIELASKGTVFRKHYTAAASTAMAFTSMATGLYCFETERKKYGQVEDYKNETIFDEMEKLGYKCHIAWDITYTSFANRHFRCYSKNTQVHSLNTIIPNHSPHIEGQFDDLTYFPNEEEKALLIIRNLFKELSNEQAPIFLWLHLPHVLSGRNSYGSDIDLFDRIIGYARECFRDEEIFISADHGHMNGTHGKFGYGFDVNEEAIRIPLIIPKINNLDTVDFPTANTQLIDIICYSVLKQNEFIYSETAYYMQPKRKIAVIHGNYKYIYEKETKKEFLYDLEWDKEEKYNLFYPEFYDIDRESWYSLNQRFFYPFWDKAHEERDILREAIRKIWRQGPFIIELYNKLLFKAKIYYSKTTKRFKRKNIINIGK